MSNIRIIREPPDPSDNPPSPKGSPPPVWQDPVPSTTASQAVPLPIAWGTVKAPILLIEKQTPVQQPPGVWPSGADVMLELIVQNKGNAYQCITAGTTAGSGGPAGTGADITDNTAHWKYLQQLPLPLYFQVFVGAICEGEIAGILTTWWDKEKQATVSGNYRHLLDFRFGVDAANQTLPAYGFDSCGYQFTALVAPRYGYGGAYTGTQKELPEIAFEVKGVMLGASTPDVSPADVVNDLLTHARRGVGWPSGRVSTTITGTGAGDFRVYCDAIGARFSLFLDGQQTALQILTDILNATNSDAVWSGGKLKIVPLGDTAIASPVYGATGYTPTNTAQYNLGINDFLDKENPVRWVSRDDVDCFNAVPIEYVDRAASYVRITVEDPDQADIEIHGGQIKRSGTYSLPMIFPDGTYPVMLSRILAQRSINIINVYTFRLPWKFILLEPTDIVTLTDPISGLNLAPVRIVQIDEGDDFTLTITAEDYPAGVAAAAGYTPEINDGYRAGEVATAAAIPSLIDGVNVGVSYGAVAGDHLSDGLRNFQNLWPNSTSEVDPPPGYFVKNDGTDAGFDFRYNAGADAYSGSWVRKMERTTSGDQILTHRVPAIPGEAYTFGVAFKWYNDVYGDSSLDVRLRFRKGDLTAISTTSHEQWNSTIGDGLWHDTMAALPDNGWSLRGGFVAPAETAYVDFVLTLNVLSNGLATIYLDAIRAVRLSISQQEAWIAPTLLNSWVDFGSGDQPSGYMKDHLGFVHLRGLVKTGTVGSPIFNLPAGYRPAKDENFPTISNGALGRLKINGTTATVGDVIPVAGSNVYFSLAGISFDTR